MLGIFVRRREVQAGITEPGAPMDTDADLVVVERSARPYDPPRRGDTPARAAWIRIAHSGLRHDTAGRANGEPMGLHVRIGRISGRPVGQQAVMGERFNIVRPTPATYGSLYELDGLNEEEGVYLRS